MSYCGCDGCDDVNCLIEHILNIDLNDMTEVKAYGR